MRKSTTVLLTLCLLLLASGLALAHGHGHVMGTVAAVSAGRIEVKTKDGKTVAVPLTAATKYFQGHQQATRSAVKIGERVVVHLGAKGEAVEVRLPAAKKA